jgi:hypothetical protein
MKKSICTVKKCPCYGRYCRTHGIASLKPLPTIKKESEKRAEVNRKEYGPKARKFVKDHPKCQAGIEGICTGASKCVHHKKGRHSKEDLLDERYWLAVCFNCHRTLEENPVFAKQHGFSISRHSKKAS